MNGTERRQLHWMRKQGDSAHGYIVDLVELMVDEVGWVCGGRVSKRHAWV